MRGEREKDGHGRPATTKNSLIIFRKNCRSPPFEERDQGNMHHNELNLLASIVPYQM